MRLTWNGAIFGTALLFISQMAWTSPSSLPGNDGSGAVLAPSEVPAPVPYAIHPAECENGDLCQCKNNFASQSGHCNHRVHFYQYREMIHLMLRYDIDRKGDVTGCSCIVWSFWRLSARHNWAYRFGGMSTPIDVRLRRYPDQRDTFSLEWYETHVQTLVDRMTWGPEDPDQYEEELDDESVRYGITSHFILTGHYNHAQLARDVAKRIVGTDSDMDVVNFPGQATAGQASARTFYEGSILPGHAGDPFQHDRACGWNTAKVFNGEWHLVNEMGISYGSSTSFSKGFSISATGGQSGGKPSWSLRGTLSFSWTESRSQSSIWNWDIRRNELSEPLECCEHAIELIDHPILEEPAGLRGWGQNAEETGTPSGGDRPDRIPSAPPYRLAEMPQGALPGCLDTLTTYCVGPNQKLRVPPSSPLIPTLKTLADNPDTPCATVGDFTAFAAYVVRTDELQEVAEDPGVPVTPQIQEVPPDKLSQPQVTENPDGSFDIDLRDAAMFFDLGSRLVELVTSSGGGSPAQAGAGETPLPGSLRQGTECQSPVTTIDFADPGSSVSIPTTLDRNQNLQTNVFVPIDSEQLGQSVEKVADLGLVLRDTVSGTMTAAAPADALVIDEKGKTVGAFFNSSGIPAGAPQAEAILVDRATELVLARRPLGGGQGAPGSAPGAEAPIGVPPFTGGTMRAMTDKPHYQPGELVNVQVLLPAGWEKLPGYEAGGFLTISWPEGTQGAFVPAGATEQTVAFPAVGQGAHDVRADLQPMNGATAGRPEFADVLEAAREAVDNRRAETEQKLAQLELVRAADAELAGLPGGGAVPWEALDWMNSQLQQERDGLEAIWQGLGE